LEKIVGGAMKKNEAIRILNTKLSPEILSSSNTHWSNLVNYGSEVGWWLNIPFHKFDKDLYMILNDEPNKCFYCIKLPIKTLTSPEKIFRNKEDTADIFMPCAGRDRMVDTQSGSSRFDFNPYQILEVKY